MKKAFLWVLGTLLLSLSATAQQSDYGLPQAIQDGNILHCFNWSINDVKNNLPNIAEAGFGSVQLSPLQRKGVTVSSVWSDVYRPYDFAFQQSNALGSAAQLKELCTEAAKYGIKVIVDVVANHVDKTSGYHDPWWDSNSAYVRSKGGNANINYNDRNSITHDRLGDYYEINSENAQVIARAKTYVQWLKDQGVSGIRWDAAKHIGLPSEGCDFWKEMASVSGMFHYGEILGTPGPSNNEALIKEYAQYMSVTDSRYSDMAASGNGGVPNRRNGEWAPILGEGKLIYWGETHDTYSNTPDYGGWSSLVSQAVVDRAYAAVACREGAAALYLSRPNASGYSNIKVVKGSDHYREAAVSEVNKFRNKMNGRSDFFSVCDDGSTISVTRNNGGAVIVKKTSGAFSVPNGGSLCPVGTYTDRVSGNTITVTAQTISGTTDATGIVVIYNDNLAPADPSTPEQGYDDSTITVYYDNSDTQWSTVCCHYWGGASSTQWPGVEMEKVEGDRRGRDLYKVKLPDGSSTVFTQGSSGPQTENSPGAVKDNHIYKGLTTKDNSNHHKISDDGVYGDEIRVYYDNSETKYNVVCCHYWGGSAESSWPGDVMTLVEGDVYEAFIPAGTTGVVFAQQDKSRQTVDVADVKDEHIYKGLTDVDSDSKNLVASGAPYAGVVEVENTPSYVVTLTEGCMHLTGLTGQAVNVYGIDGTARFAAGATRGSLDVRLATGVYIVRVGADAFKILIR